MVESLVKDAGNRLLTRAARKRARQGRLPLRSVTVAVRFRHLIGFDIRSLMDLCKNSRHRTARVSKRTPFGAATVRERTQQFTWFPSAGEQVLTEPRAVTGVFTNEHSSF